MHSSRIRTVRCSGRRGAGEGSQHALGRGCVYPSMHWVGGGGVSEHALGGGCLPSACWDTPPPHTVERILDTRLWKHYLSAITLLTVKFPWITSSAWFNKILNLSFLRLSWSTEEVCYSELGCFSTNPPFHLLPLPWQPEAVNVNLNLVTKNGSYHFIPPQQDKFP